MSKTPGFSFLGTTSDPIHFDDKSVHWNSVYIECHKGHGKLIEGMLQAAFARGRASMAEDLRTLLEVERAK